MATSKISIDEGTTTNTATNTISEDAVTKHIPRTVINTSAGVEVAPLTDAQIRATALPVSAASLPLPSGAATSAKQDTLDTSVNTLLKPASTLAAVTAITNVVHVDDNGGALTVDGTVAVTNAGITSIDGKITACNTGAVTVAASALPSGASTSALQGGGLPAALGAGGGLKVDGSGTALPVSLASVPSHAVTNAGTFATQATLQAGTAEIGKLAAGTANIGDVDVATIAAGDNNIGNVDLASAIPAGTNNIGDVDVLSFANGKTILRAVISGATSGDNTIVAADATKKIKVLSVFLVAATAVAVRFESGAGGTALTGVMSIGATGGFVLPPPSDPSNHWFETAANALLNMELGGAVQVSGAITYYLEA